MELIDKLNNLLPKYKAILPFSKKEVEFIPFKIRDAKNISIILQEENKILSFIAMVEILKRNVPDLNVNELCMADAEFLFLQIRSKSVDEVLNLIYQKNKIQVNINDIQPKNNIQEKSIVLNKDVVLELHTPTVKNLIKLKSLDREDFFKSCIKSINVGNEIYDCTKFVPEELKELINNLPLNVSNKIDEFIKIEPQLFLNIELDGQQKEVTGILNFFTYR
jgi:hypothetical protein